MNFPEKRRNEETYERLKTSNQGDQTTYLDPMAETYQVIENVIFNQRKNTSKW